MKNVETIIQAHREIDELVDKMSFGVILRPIEDKVRSWLKTSMRMLVFGQSKQARYAPRQLRDILHLYGEATVKKALPTLPPRFTLYIEAEEGNEGLVLTTDFA